MMQPDMRCEFANREDLIVYVQEQFPFATAPEYVSATRGGRRAAEERLAAQDLRRYDRTRNYLDGDVSRLSMYIRHGVLSLAEVRDFAHRSGAPEKFLNELGWRDFYQRVYAELGDGIWHDREPYKTGFEAAEYADELPDDVRFGQTGTCMDLFCRELIETGYLHNHARMYLAAYVVHWRRVKWQAGARWFLEHLLDGDPASNNLSWQWVASTFSHKPYFFNADNLRRYGAGKYPELAQDLLDPFEGSYPEIERRLFPKKEPEQRIVAKSRRNKGRRR